MYVLLYVSITVCMYYSMYALQYLCITVCIVGFTVCLNYRMLYYSMYVLLYVCITVCMVCITVCITVWSVLQYVTVCVVCITVHYSRYVFLYYGLSGVVLVEVAVRGHLTQVPVIDVLQTSLVQITARPLETDRRTDQGFTTGHSRDQDRSTGQLVDM